MKQLFTLCLALMSVTAMAQWPSLPYNPDENGDGLIGVVDLAALLAQYNTEFASAVVSEDGEIAIVRVGALTYFDCLLSCASLPGRWALIDEHSAAMAAPEIVSGYAWIDLASHHWHQQGNVVTAYRTDGAKVDWVHGDSWDNSNDCFCAAKQLPRVEYDYCLSHNEGSYVYNMESALSELKSCVDLKLAEGWQLLGAIEHGPSYSRYTQALWRWAE